MCSICTEGLLQVQKTKCSCTSSKSKVWGSAVTSLSTAFRGIQGNKKSGKHSGGNSCIGISQVVLVCILLCTQSLTWQMTNMKTWGLGVQSPGTVCLQTPIHLQHASGFHQSASPAPGERHLNQKISSCMYYSWRKNSPCNDKPVNIIWLCIFFGGGCCLFVVFLF